MLLQVGVVIECHSTLFTHNVFGLQVDFVDVLTKVGVFPLTMWAFSLEKMGLLFKANCWKVNVLP